MLSKDQPPGAAQRPGRVRRLRWATIVPCAVFAGIAATAAYSVWPMLSQAKTVRVVQAVFDQSSAAAAAIASGGGLPEDASQPAASASSAAARPVSSVTVQAAGWLEAEPYAHAATALIDGVVAQVLALEGDYIEQGSIVARLVDDDAKIKLRQREAALASAEAQLALAQADQRAAESAWAAPVELDRAVASGAAALEESRAELAQLPSLIEAAEATLIRLDEEYQRAHASHERGGTTELEMIVAKQRAATQRAEVAAIRARQPLLEARLHRLQAELRAAQRALELRIDDRRALDGAQASVQSAKAVVQEMQSLRDQAALELERTIIRAPISGYVQQRHRAPGDKVAVMMDDPYSAHILHMYDPDRLQVRVDVPLADAAHVFPGQRCEVVVEVLPDRVFAGEVIRITHRADLQKNTLQMKVRVIEPSPMLRPEMLARVRFLPSDAAAASARSSSGRDAVGVSAAMTTRVLIPEAALDRRSEGDCVWTIVDRRNNRGTLRSVAVRTETSEQGWVRVSGAVTPGSLLALPEGTMREGQRVVIGHEAVQTEGERAS